LAAVVVVVLPKLVVDEAVVVALGVVTAGLVLRQPLVVQVAV
jgi:hypothetical protein